MQVDANRKTYPTPIGHLGIRVRGMNAFPHPCRRSPPPDTPSASLKSDKNRVTSLNDALEENTVSRTQEMTEPWRRRQDTNPCTTTIHP